MGKHRRECVRLFAKYQRLIELPTRSMVNGQRSQSTHNARIELQNLAISLGSFHVAAGRSETGRPVNLQKKI